MKEMIEKLKKMSLIKKIITIYTEMRRKINRTFCMEKRLPFYSMKGIRSAYFGLVKCKDIVKLLTDNQGKLFKNIFEVVEFE